MNRIFNFIIARPWWMLLTVVLLSAVSTINLDSLNVRISAEELLVRDDPERLFYQEVNQTFGDEQAVLLYLQSDTLLAKEKLTVLRRVIERLEELPFVERTESLFNVPHVRTVDGYLEKEPYLAVLPETETASREILNAALDNPFLKRVLLSEDGKVMAVAIVLVEGRDELDDDEVTAAIEWATGELDGVYENVFTIGFPHVRTEIAQNIVAEQGKLFPLAIAALLIALFLMLRQLVDILIPILTAGTSILWTLGFMAAVDIPLNVVTSLVPILLIIVGSTEDIHLISEFRHGQKRGLQTRPALQLMARKMGSIVLLTFITTYLGFLSIGLSGIEALWQFGVVASTGLLFNFIATILLIPSILAFAGKWQWDGRSRLFLRSTVQTAENYWKWLERHRPVIVIFLVVSISIAVTGIPRIKINNNPVDSLGKESIVRSHFASVNENLAGLESISVVIDSNIQDTFLKVHYLEQLVAIQDFIEEKIPSSSTTSFADYLALLNGAFQELDEAVLPDSDDTVTELMIFLNHEHVKSYITEDFRRTRILVRHHVASTEELQEFVDSLQTFLITELDQGLHDVKITGSSVLRLSATRAMIGGQIQSIIVLLLIIVAIIALLFADLKVGLLAALPNLLPVLVLFGFMGYAQIPLNIGTTMAAAIAIGIAVDDTLHFMLRYNRELKAVKSHNLAMHSTIYGEALPILSTSLALIAGFMVFTLSTFEPIIQFGMLGAIVIGTALVADFIVTPLIIASLRLVTIWDLISVRVRKQILAKSILFRGMRPWQIRQFILSGTMADYEENEYVFHQGDVSNALYMVLSGKVQVCMPAEDNNSCNVMEQFVPGDVFGDVALFAGLPRKSHAITEEPTTLLVLSREAIENTTRRRPLIAARIFQNLTMDISRRMIAMVAKTSSATDRHPDQRNKD